MAQIGIKDRLHGARLAAGIVKLKRAAELLGVSEATYRHGEKGIRSTSEHLLSNASALFGVSVQYLTGAPPSSPAEDLADRLAAVVAAVDINKYESPKGYGELLERLRTIRVAEGHANANAAAEAHDWNRTVYWQHESGGRGVTLDRMIAYCLSMGARPEYGVLGQDPLPETTRVSWSERKREQEVAAATPPPLR